MYTTTRRRLAVAAAGALLASSSAGLSAAPASATEPCEGARAVQSVTYTVTHSDGMPTTVIQRSGREKSYNLPGGTVRPGDTVAVDFVVAAGCEDVDFGVATYRAASADFDPNAIQYLYRSSTVENLDGGATGHLEVTAPATAGGRGPGCTNPHPAPLVRKGKGANVSGAYDSTCDGSPSMNGKGDGNANGKPCAGCVGNADYKNPPGQAPDGSDSNAGYECDRNQGVGKSNPAHSGCVPSGFFQFDVFTGPVLAQVGPAGSGNFYGGNNRLIAAALG